MCLLFLLLSIYKWLFPQNVYLKIPYSSSKKYLKQPWVIKSSTIDWLLQAIGTVILCSLSECNLNWYCIFFRTHFRRLGASNKQQLNITTISTFFLTFLGLEIKFKSYLAKSKHFTSYFIFCALLIIWCGKSLCLTMGGV